MVKVKQAPDPWQRTTTENGFPADEVISALQKSIRRGMVDNALLLAWEMYITSPEMEEMLWSRLMASGQKDRTSDDMANWARQSVTLGEQLPEIPDVAIDMHTGRGEAMGPIGDPEPSW